MPDESGSFELPKGVPNPGLDDPYGLSINVDSGGHLTPIVTVPGGDLQPSEQWSSPNQGAFSTTPFDPDHNSLDAANHLVVSEAFTDR